MTQRDHDRQERLYEDLGDVVYKEGLERARALRDDRTRRIRPFEVVRDRVRVGEHNGRKVQLRERG